MDTVMRGLPRHTRGRIVPYAENEQITQLQTLERRAISLSWRRTRLLFCSLPPTIDELLWNNCPRFDRIPRASLWRRRPGP